MPDDRVRLPLRWMPKLNSVNEGGAPAYERTIKPSTETSSSCSSALPCIGDSFALLTLRLPKKNDIFSESRRADINVSNLTTWQHAENGLFHVLSNWGKLEMGPSKLRGFVRMCFVEPGSVRCKCEKFSPSTGDGGVIFCMLGSYCGADGACHRETCSLIVK